MLTNQFRILAALEPNEAPTHNLKAEILERGLEAYYYEVYDHYMEPIASEIGVETGNILEMYFALDYSMDDLTPEEKATLKVDRLTFMGFDGNRDDHYSVMQFLVERYGKFEEWKGKKYNSHGHPSIDYHRRLLKHFQKLVAANGGIQRLKYPALKELSDAL